MSLLYSLSDSTGNFPLTKSENSKAAFVSSPPLNDQPEKGLKPSFVFTHKNNRKTFTD